ncbi:hypothetical protein PENSTE_c010G05682 [Penicillium steckii]|uniref:Uncharacterized protein n=1 Tax=Penicillium steckii TaxID=303698 RepID=A0A1V6T7W0_9EURO|nr:hypothetical protein PENSTE_c010G05682 [Penicillium steckii]
MKLAVLKNNQDWPQWNLQIIHILKKRGFTHLLKDKPNPQSESPQDLKTWNREQKTACAIVISRLDPKIAKAMQAHKLLKPLLIAIDNFTKPTGEEALQMLCTLWKRLSSLSSSNHSSITEYCTEARDIQMQYQRLGTGISDAVLSCAFLSGLPSDWSHWKYQQTQKTSVLVPWCDVGSSTFTFSNLVLDALDEESRLYRVALRTEEVKWGMRIKDVRDDSATVVIDFCTSCKGVFHNSSECSGSRLYLQAKRAQRKGNKRRRADSMGKFTRLESVVA